MRQLFSILMILFISKIGHSQTDSIYIGNKSKLIYEARILIPLEDDSVVIEYYNSFKYRFWKIKVDTCSTIETLKFSDKKPKKQWVYSRIGACDSLINEIRNNATYYAFLQEIEELAKKEIGHTNIEFRNYKNRNRTKEFHELCNDEFLIHLVELNLKYLEEIERIKITKMERFERMKNADLIESATIASFIETFDKIEIDYKVLEIIILKNPENYITEINKLDENDFNELLYLVRNLPININLSEMKKALNNSGISSKRSKQLGRKMKHSKQ